MIQFLIFFILFLLGASIARCAHTRVLAEQIDTRGTILARSTRALVNVDLASLARIARLARTIEQADLVSTRATVQTRIAHALVDVDLAVKARVASLTNTLVSID